MCLCLFLFRVFHFLVGLFQFILSKNRKKSQPKAKTHHNDLVNSYGPYLCVCVCVCVFIINTDRFSVRGLFIFIFFISFVFSLILFIFFIYSTSIIFLINIIIYFVVFFRLLFPVSLLGTYPNVMCVHFPGIWHHQYR